MITLDPCNFLQTLIISSSPCIKLFVAMASKLLFHEKCSFSSNRFFVSTNRNGFFTCNAQLYTDASVIIRLLYNALFVNCKIAGFM